MMNGMTSAPEAAKKASRTSRMEGRGSGAGKLLPRLAMM